MYKHDDVRRFFTQKFVLFVEIIYLCIRKRPLLLEGFCDWCRVVQEVLGLFIVDIRCIPLLQHINVRSPLRAHTGERPYKLMMVCDFYSPRPLERVWG